MTLGRKFWETPISSKNSTSSSLSDFVPAPFALHWNFYLMHLMHPLNKFLIIFCLC